MIIFITHILVIAIATIVAIVLHQNLPTPTAQPMGTSEQYRRNARNICINVAAFLVIGLTIEVAVNLLAIGLFGLKLLNELTALLWVFISVIIWMVWPQKLLYVPSSNSVTRVTNRIFTGTRDLPHNQGHVDNSVKYKGPIFALLNIFDIYQGEIETESREGIKVKIDQLTFADDVGSGEVVIVYAVEDSDAYAAGGDTPTLREKKVRDAIEARIKSMIEIICQGKPVRTVMSDPSGAFGDMVQAFQSQNQNIEARLGIRVQIIEVSEINESQEHRKALSAKGTNEALRDQARQMVEDSDNTMSFETAMEIVSANANASGNFTYKIFRGLEGGNTRTMIDPNK